MNYLLVVQVFVRIPLRQFAIVPAALQANHQTDSKRSNQARCARGRS
ncbi:hypothetical protein P608_02515 [Comamonas thiooxydans]|uniref:Uncharacterized protein n=1 Tax=Comamonas thiooxydans TaxID=363952 RepID=D8DEE5_9BURK|nr:hypothetical protein CTS44_26043 [Comamonas thiooxydans]KGH20710.1 hypothetical protein P608_02515 [Comamonas thiooxydans]KGH22411.1 hypothetical protein P607_07425 [Comamonas thiooxydans]